MNKEQTTTAEIEKVVENVIELAIQNVTKQKDQIENKIITNLATIIEENTIEQSSESITSNKDTLSLVTEADILLEIPLDNENLTKKVIVKEKDKTSLCCGVFNWFC